LQRESFHEVAEPVFMEVVEELIRRPVETVLSATNEARDVSTLVFLLEPAESAALRDTDLGLRRMGEQTRRRAAEVREESQALREKQQGLRESFEKNRRR
jgi:hypothetical protein